MDNMDEELNTALYQKMFDEQEQFINELCLFAGEEVLKHAYEYVIRDDILLTLEYSDLSDEECRVLLSLEKPLEAIYRCYTNNEDDHMEHVFDVIKRFARVMVRDARNAQN